MAMLIRASWWTIATTSAVSCLALASVNCPARLFGSRTWDTSMRGGSWVYSALSRLASTPYGYRTAWAAYKPQSTGSLKTFVSRHPREATVRRIGAPRHDAFEPQRDRAALNLR